MKYLGHIYSHQSHYLLYNPS